MAPENVEEESQELQEYCKDDSTFNPNHELVSFQDKQSTGNWSSVKKQQFEPPKRRVEHHPQNSGSMQSFYKPDHRQYSSTVDHYEPLH